MNLDELRSVQSKERQTDSLQHLRESFYGDASAYISELEAERDRRAGEVEDPFADPEVRRLTDEIETAREVVEAIYDRRLGKLVKRASLAAADMPSDEEGLTAEEQALYDDLVELIEANKTQVLDVLDADPEREEVAAEEAAAVAGPDEGPGPDDDPSGATPTVQVVEPDQPPTSSAGDDGPGSDGETAPAEGHSGSSGDGQPDAGASAGDESQDPAGLDGRTTVRITGDVGEIFGVDQREYDLEPETVVTLPAENAEPLLESGDAERVE